MRVPFARPSVGDEEIDAVARVIRSGWLTTGQEALAFEKEFALTLNVPYALATNSATAGLHLALEAVGTSAGDVVIVPSLTFTATAEVVRYLGAEVAFADIAADGMCLDPSDVARIVAETRSRGTRVAAIIVVHLAGEIGPVRELASIASSCGAALIEDAAHAFPSLGPQGYAGTLGDIGVFSFYANKTITTGEGGMVVTANAAYAERVRTMRLHGIDREAWDRYSNPRGSWRYDVVEAGYKYNMTDIAAAIGRVQLAKAERLLSMRRERALRYIEAFDDLADEGQIALPRDSAGHAWHLFILRLLDPSISRDAVIQALQSAEIGVSVHYAPLHGMSYWRKRYPEATLALPHTERRFSEILSIPLYPDLRRDQQQYVIETLRQILEAGDLRLGERA